MRFILAFTFLLFWNIISGQVLSKENITSLSTDSLSFHQISYKSDSFVVEGYIVEPVHSSNTPIIIFNRGGNKNQYKITHETLVDWIAPIAAAGYTVFASQYRKEDEFGGSEINDVLNLIQLAKNHPDVDSSRIGMVGWSRGGLMTYIALSKTHDIDCAIIGGAPTNMFELIKERPRMENVLESHIPNYEVEKEKMLSSRSPVLWGNELKPTKLFILHGTNDQRVHVSHARKMAKQLDSINYPYQLKIFEGDDHILSNNRKEKDQLIVEWLNSNLQ